MRLHIQIRCINRIYQYADYAHIENIFTVWKYIRICGKPQPHMCISAWNRLASSNIDISDIIEEINYTMAQYQYQKIIATLVISNFHQISDDSISFLRNHFHTKFNHWVSQSIIGTSVKTFSRRLCLSFARCSIVARQQYQEVYI